MDMVEINKDPGADLPGPTVSPSPFWIIWLTESKREEKPEAHNSHLDYTILNKKVNFKSPKNWCVILCDYSRYTQNYAIYQNQSKDQNLEPLILQLPVQLPVPKLGMDLPRESFLELQQLQVTAACSSLPCWCQFPLHGKTMKNTSCVENQVEMSCRFNLLVPSIFLVCLFGEHYLSYIYIVGLKYLTYRIYLV